MQVGKHRDTGENTGRAYQNPGRHRSGKMDRGIGFIPLGDRSRDIGYGEGILEERVSLDGSEKYLRFDQSVNRTVSEIKSSGSITGLSF